MLKKLKHLMDITNKRRDENGASGSNKHEMITKNAAADNTIREQSMSEREKKYLYEIQVE